MMQSPSFLIAYGLSTLLFVSQSAGQQLSGGPSTAEIVRSRGYEAIEHEVITSDGYILNVVEAINPRIRQQTSKDPILCVHGILTRATFFLVNPDEGDYAKDNANLDIASMSTAELNRRFQNDPASKSIVYLALNVGYRLFLLNKRGTRESIGHVDPSKQAFVGATRGSAASNVTSESRQSPLAGLVGSTIDSLSTELALIARDVNPKYWNYSLDEQAKFDIPEVIDFVLERSGKDKLIYIGHSAGAGLAAMALVDQPSLADKLSKVILWAPAFNLGAPSLLNAFTIIRPVTLVLLDVYVGPFAPSLLDIIFRDVVRIGCNIPILDRICLAAVDALLGPTGGQFDFVTQFADAFGTTGSHELVHTTQNLYQRFPRKFDYGTLGNLRAYRQTQPPIYDASLITSRQISIFYGNTDTLVTPKDVRLFIGDLRVPTQNTFINGSGVFFNHFQFAFHPNVAELLIIPTLRMISQ